MDNYLEEQRKRVKKNYNKKYLGFGSSDDFANWYVEQLKINDCKCFYCDTSIHDIAKLIDQGKLRKRKIRYGSRGNVLEIDKNNDSYSQENCVLACYYCNNDKSYIFEKNDYKNHFGSNRKLYFEKLLAQLNNS